jgi:branched-chain amino acid transport system substrate-binding protein
MLLLSIIFSLCLTVSGCGKKDETIRIGVAGPMTGQDAKMGADFRNGVSLALDEWNAASGLFGKKIEFLVEDDASDPKQAHAVANKLVNQGVVAVVGHFNSSCSIPASEVYDRAGKPMITPASTSPKLTSQGFKGVFRVCGTDDQQGMVGAQFVRDRAKLKRVAVLHDKTTYGQGLADYFRGALGPLVEVVYYGGITRGDKDFKTVLTAAKEKKPELIFFGGVYPEAGLLVKQSREIGLAAPLMSGDASIDPKFVEIAGEKAAEGSYLTFSPDPKHFPQSREFLEKYRKKYGEPGPYSIYAYVAANIILEAIRDAGTTDGTAITGKLRAREFATALGAIRFNAKGDIAQAPYIVWITRNGKFEEYWKP